MRRVAAITAAAVVLLAAALIVRSAGGSGGGTYTVRAIFDDASFAAAGEDVRIAGANVGSITALGVTADKRAAVTLSISDRRFAPFHADASCAIRPQSLIGEQYVDCQPGSAAAPALARVARGPGAGSYLLPVTRTSSPIDSDIVQNISTEPVRQSLAVIINEFGTALAARGSDLNAVIHRANPALGDTDRVLKILAGQNHVLAELATSSDTVLAPLARERSRLSDFVVQANTTAVASAARAADIRRTFALFPSFLRQLRPLMADLGALADQGTPLLRQLGTSASALGRQFANLTEFAAKARTSLIDLGTAAQQSQPALVATLPLAQRLQRVGSAGAPTAANLDKLTASLNRTGAIQQLMSLLFNGASAGNGFTALGHFVRDEPLVSSCTSYATTPVPGCSANFVNAAKASAATAAPATPDAVVSAALSQTSASAPTGGAASLHGLLGYLIGSGR